MVPRTFVVVAGLLVASVAAAPAVAQDAAAAAALDYIRGSRQTLGLTGSDVGDVVVSSVVRSDHNRVTHVYLQQRYRGIEVWSGILNVAVDANSAVVSAQSRFVTNIASQAGGQNAKKAALDAVAAAAGHVRLKPTRAFEVLQHKGGPSEAVTLSDGGISLKPIEARLVWVPLEGAVRLGWMVEIEEVGGAHWWQAFVDAETGASLGQHDLIVHDSAHAIAAAIARPADSPAALPTFAATDGAAYRVFPLPFESPNDGDRSLVTNAADPASSPFGWHDTNGVAGPEFTRTRGNNVHAYADRDANNTADPGSDPDGGPGLLFDFNLDLLARPLDSQPAIVTNLFYWNNIVHDVTYRYGFNEAAGNFQVNNYGKGGLGNDDVRAEAQDGSGRNNANFGTNVDGARPRMQMFEWRSSAPNPITVTAPAAAAGTYYGPMAGFGESLVTTGPIAGEVVYIGRGCDPAYQAGQPLDPYLASPAGKIALTERGSCTFVAKVKKAQDSGARAVIVANNIVGSPIAMGGADPTISIPSVMVSLDDGTLFKANVPLTATIADGTGGVPDRDSDLDAGVIAHEYGHGISNRLTGGPATVACLGNAEQMGEGWSDWFALTLTTHPSDTGTTPRGVGTYVNFEPADGLGIRPTQYTTDMTVNPSTYASVADTVNISQPHGIGYVWNTMLWEMYWNLVDRYGYNADIYDSWNTGEQPGAAVGDGRPEVPGVPTGFRRRPHWDPPGRRGVDRWREPVRDLARVRQAWPRRQREPGQLERPDRRRRSVRPAGQLHGGDLRWIHVAHRGSAGRQRRQCRLRGAREVHGRSYLGRHACRSRFAAGELLDARADGRGAGGTRLARVNGSRAGRQRVSRQLADRPDVGRHMPTTDGETAGSQRRDRLLPLLLRSKEAQRGAVPGLGESD